MTRAAWLLLALVGAVDASPKHEPTDRDHAAEVQRRKEAERKRAEREKAIRECMDDRDGDPDEDRELCEDEVGP